jgi:uncharacterized protein YecT (DUF1311 family)
MPGKVSSPTAAAVLASAAVAVLAIAAASQARGGATAPAAGSLSAHVAKLSPPVIHETFTPLPCSGKPADRTTLQQEGCAEQQILKTDAEINSVAKAIFPLLHDDPARRRFITAQRAWFAYRRADCLSMSDVFEDGSESPVVAAQCAASRNNRRLGDLRSLRRALSRTG